MKQRVRRVFLTTFLLVLLVGTGAWLLSPRQGLLDHAARLADTSDWLIADPANLNAIPHFWINDQEVAFFKREKQAGLRLYREIVLPTGKAKAAIPTNITFPAGSIVAEPSPDRRYLPYLRLVTALPKKQRKASYAPAIVSLTDGTHFPMFDDWFLPHCFTADSKGVVTIQWINRFCAQVRDIESRKTSITPLPAVNTSPSRPTFSVLFIEPDGRITLVDNGPFFYPSLARRITPAAARLNYLNSQQIRFMEIDTKHRILAPRTWSIPAPQDATNGRLIFSPQHDRILWIAYSQNDSLMDRACGRSSRN